MSAVELTPGGQLAVAEHAEPTEPSEVTTLVRLAIEQKVDVAVLERLVALQERVFERQAEMAMAQALADFQADCPPIPRVRTAEVKKNGVKQYEYHFAPFEKVVEVIRPHLTKHGLSYTHDGEITSGSVSTTCTLQHVDGARRTSTFTGPVDNSGGKNPLQAVGSARSYGRRYTLIDVLGLTTEEDDDAVGSHGGNGNGGEPETLSKEQVADLAVLIDEVKADKARFLAYMGVESLEEIYASNYTRAVDALEAKRAQ